MRVNNALIRTSQNSCVTEFALQYINQTAEAETKHMLPGIFPTAARSIQFGKSGVKTQRKM